MNYVRAKLIRLAVTVSDLEDTQNPMILIKYRHLDDEQLREQLRARIRKGYADLVNDAPLFALAGITLTGDERSSMLRGYADIVAEREK